MSNDNLIDDIVRDLDDTQRQALLAALQRQPYNPTPPQEEATLEELEEDIQAEMGKQKKDWQKLKALGVRHNALLQNAQQLNAQQQAQQDALKREAIELRKSELLSRLRVLRTQGYFTSPQKLAEMQALQAELNSLMGRRYG